MHFSLSRASLALAGLLAFPLTAQETVAPPPVETIGSEPVDGLLPGTKRYNVRFDDRSFTLAEFRDAVYGGKSADDVERIVAKLQAQAYAQRDGFRRQIEEMGGRVETTFWLIDACTIDIKPGDVGRVLAMPGVVGVDPDLVVHHAIRTATNASNHNSDAVQAAGNRGTGFAVAIIDTGQDSNMGGSGRPHRIYYRGGNVANTTGGGLGGSLLLANVAIPGTLGADDLHGHGTGVMGIAAGSIWGNASADDGHANDAFKVGYSICQLSGSCSTSLSIEAAAWQQAAADKVRYNIVSANMSYGSSPTMTDVSQQAIDGAALNANILACCAAGNSGTGGTAGSAAVANGLAAAAATGNSKSIASFSTRGPMGSRTYPDIAGNGVSTVMPARNAEASNFIASGTSMGSPEVCGVGALVKYARPTASAREIKAILLASSENVAGYTENAGGQGYLRADRATACAASPDSALTDSIASTTTPKDHVLRVTAGQTVKVALTWYRHNLGSATYSNLGLTVLNGATTVATKNSTANLYEVVSFTAPITGNLTVRVNATSLAINPQPYSVAAAATSGTQPAFQNGLTGSVSIDGAGCPGTGGIPSAHPSGNPRINSSFTVNLTYARPSTSAFMFLGVSNSSWLGIGLPFNLTGLGAPNCFLRVSGEVVASVPVGATGTGGFTLALPNATNLIGAAVFSQFLVLDPPINTLDLVASNSLRIVIGDR
ncbi:MAG: S8 family serine peptidase [Planctomycetota bacterium]